MSGRPHTGCTAHPIDFQCVTHERIISMEDIFSQIHTQLSEEAVRKGTPAILAIDGRCASGKSTLAARLADAWDASLFHMDDFYLQPAQRTAERLAEPGGNVDRERFLEEVLLPLTEGKPITYRRFDCHSFSFDPEQIIHPKPIAIVEGSYSCHPALRGFYDVRIFLDIDPETQMQRILKRNGPECADRFRTRWIPLEETYFRECRIRENCEYDYTDTNPMYETRTVDQVH